MITTMMIDDDNGDRNDGDRNDESNDDTTSFNDDNDDE